VTNKRLKELLEEHAKNEEDIANVAAPLYQRRNELVRELMPEFIKRKAPDCNGMLLAPLTLKYKDGTSYTLKPMYVSAQGQFKGAVHKNYGVELFTIVKKTKN
jgi:hypothetical protein